MYQRLSAAVSSAMLLCMLPSYAADTPALTVPTGYGHFELRPIKVDVARIAPEVQGKFQETVSRLMEPTLARWNEDGQRSGRAGTLAIEVTLTDMKFVSGTKRFWIGPLAGSSHSAGAVAYIDVASGRELASQSFTDASGAWAGSVTIGARDNRMISALASQMANYVAQCSAICFGNPVPGSPRRHDVSMSSSGEAALPSVYDQLVKLDDLRKRGILTEQEFQEQKKAILDRQKK